MSAGTILSSVLVIPNLPIKMWAFISGQFSPATVVISFAGVFAAYYYFLVVKRPKIYVNNAKISTFLRSHVGVLEEKYFPSFFYWEGRLQTILSAKKRLPNAFKLPYRREIFKLSDGGELALDFINEEILHKQKEERETINNNSNEYHAVAEAGIERRLDDIEDEREKEKLIVLLLPGLTSSSQTYYIKTLVLAIQRAGAMVVTFNNRGIGGIPLKTPRTHNACNCDDIHEVITHLRKRYPDQRIMAIGTSMGGILLSRYLITYPEESRNTFVAAFVISVVWDMWAAIESLNVPYINKYVINRGICDDVIYRVKRSQKVLEKRKGLWDFEAVYASKSGVEFDSRFHVPQFGYKSIEDYYGNCLLSTNTHKFPLPVFALNAHDDPMMPGEKLPTDEVHSTKPESNLALIVTSRGGHLGFLEGFSAKPKPDHYMERLTEQIVRAVRLYGDELRTGTQMHL